MNRPYLNVLRDLKSLFECLDQGDVDGADDQYYGLIAEIEDDLKLGITVRRMPELLVQLKEHYHKDAGIDAVALEYSEAEQQFTIVVNDANGKIIDVVTDGDAEAIDAFSAASFV